MNIGLTGGIACGKSTVSSMLVEKGAALVDADRIAREVVLPGEPALKQIVDRFGQAVLLEDGSLNRKQLGSIVFADDESRKDLEAILHPTIRARMKEQMAAYEREIPDRLVVVDVPLLYESKLQELFQAVLVVYVPEEVQLKRLMERDGILEKDAMNRIKSQMPIEEKKKKADLYIDNSGSMEQTKQQVDLFWQKYVIGKQLPSRKGKHS
ncbi:dephospho-CoA kinase [Marinicrinis lubricantis]|uniref:Dephospho-CoA kinase n=1 Tax=Marinicrinis lubricantis TaxID=2086470 RepID=A0ABW1IHH2_9BACL